VSIPGICNAVCTVYLTKEAQPKLMTTPLFHFRTRENTISSAYLYAKKKGHAFKMLFCDSVLQNSILLVLMNLAILEDFTIQKSTVL